jgi:hypothetical protein
MQITGRSDRHVLVVIPRLKKIDSFFGHAVYEPVFLSNPPGPASGENVPQWLGLSRPAERITKDGIYEIQYP